MTDSSNLNSSLESTPSNGVINISGGVKLDAGQVDISGEVIGRDRVESAGGHIVHAAAGATVIIGASAEAIGAGLVVLSELMQRSSDVRNDVIAFQTDFRAAREQIALLSGYKDLHDLLHDLQLHCYKGVVQAAAGFPEDISAVSSLNDYAMTLGNIVDNLRQVIARVVLPEQDVSWIDSVGTAKTNLNDALELSDKDLLKAVIWNLSRVLNTQPVLINKSLTQTARVLRLPSLTEALARIYNRLTTLDLDAGKVERFRTSVDALRHVDLGLTVLVNEHDNWQALDRELRLIEGTIDRDFFDLQMSWPEVKARADRLCSNVADEWAQNLLKEGRGLDAALAANNPLKIKTGFNNFQRRVSIRFFQVDKNLKALCDDLRRIGEPLTSVLEMIE